MLFKGPLKISTITAISIAHAHSKTLENFHISSIGTLFSDDNEAISRR